MRRNYFSIAWKCLKDSDYRFATLAKLGIYNSIPDEEFLKRLYKGYLGKELDLNNPVTYNEKLQWLKIYNRKPIHTIMVDKYEAKKFVAERIGEEHIIPTLGVWDRFDDIDFDALPNRFVLKCTHDSGGVVICKDKSKLDKASAKRKINKSLKNNYFWFGREWPYKDLKPRIIAEQYMEDDTTHDLRDYKIFTFNGVAKALFVATDRYTDGEETKFDFYDMDFNHLDFTNGHPNASVEITKPATLKEMHRLAEILAKDTPHLRVDFYEINGKVYFGELTFFHWSGLIPFEPEEWDYTFGEWIKLPQLTDEA